jgi:hypothetical protein
MAYGLRCTPIVTVTLLVTVSITETESLPEFTTYTSSRTGFTAMPVGSLPTLTTRSWRR